MKRRNFIKTAIGTALAGFGGAVAAKGIDQEAIKHMARESGVQPWRSILEDTIKTARDFNAKFPDYAETVRKERFGIYQIGLSHDNRKFVYIAIRKGGVIEDVARIDSRSSLSDVPRIAVNIARKRKANNNHVFNPILIAYRREGIVCGMEPAISKLSSESDEVFSLLACTPPEYSKSMYERTLQAKDAVFSGDFDYREGPVIATDLRISERARQNPYPWLEALKLAFFA